MRRREFISLLGGAVAIPLVARAQQGELVRRIGVLLPATTDDSEYPTLVKAFVGELQKLGWTEGRNVRIDIRWAGGGIETNRRYAEELVALAPDVIMAAGNASAGPSLQATRTIPVVFTIVPDPVGAGLVDSLARPIGNATGFASFGYDIGGKWLELLKEIAPRVTRVAVLRDSALTAGVGQWSAIQTAAPSFGVEAVPISLNDARELERAIAKFAGSANGGMIVTSSGLSIKYRDTIVMQAAKQKLPTVYYGRGFVSAGGLISYGSDRVEQFRSAANYVDRILRGAKPADLPVQSPTKYQLVINLKTAKALGLTVPLSLLSRADEVIEYGTKQTWAVALHMSAFGGKADITSIFRARGHFSAGGCAISFIIGPKSWGIQCRNCCQSCWRWGSSQRLRRFLHLHRSNRSNRAKIFVRRDARRRTPETFACRIACQSAI